MTWQDRAACRDDPHPECWFPARPADYHNAQRALHICFSCPVRAECLENALCHERETKQPIGISGGSTPNERQKMLASSPT